MKLPEPLSVIRNKVAAENFSSLQEACGNGRRPCCLPPARGLLPRGITKAEGVRKQDHKAERPSKGVVANSAAALALCRGEIPAEYLIQKLPPNMDSSARQKTLRPSSLSETRRLKLACVAGGRSRSSGVVRRPRQHSFGRELSNGIVRRPDQEEHLAAAPAAVPSHLTSEESEPEVDELTVAPSSHSIIYSSLEDCIKVRRPSVDSTASTMTSEGNELYNGSRRPSICSSEQSSPSEVDELDLHHWNDIKSITERTGSEHSREEQSLCHTAPIVKAPLSEPRPPTTPRRTGPSGRGRVPLKPQVPTASACACHSVAADHLECAYCFDDLRNAPAAILLAPQDRLDRFQNRAKQSCGHWLHKKCAAAVAAASRISLKAEPICPSCCTPFQTWVSVPDPFENPESWFETLDVRKHGTVQRKTVLFALQAALPVEAAVLEALVPGKDADRLTLSDCTALLAALPEQLSKSKRSPAAGIPEIRYQRAWFFHWEPDREGRLSRQAVTRALVKTFHDYDLLLLRAAIDVSWAEAFPEGQNMVGMQDVFPEGLGLVDRALAKYKSASHWEAWKLAGFRDSDDTHGFGISRS